LQEFAQSGSSGKTSPVRFPVQKDKTLQQFWAASADGECPHLYELPETIELSDSPGETLESSPESLKLMDLLGECWTLNISESPRCAIACSLSDILETGNHLPAYYLSEKAIVGILRRSKRPDPIAQHYLISHLSRFEARKTSIQCSLI
jgi:hypothetical protein